MRLPAVIIRRQGAVLLRIVKTDPDLTTPGDTMEPTAALPAPPLTFFAHVTVQVGAPQEVGIKPAPGASPR